MLMAFGSETVFKQITLFDHFGTIAMSGEGKLASLIWLLLNAHMHHRTFFFSNTPGPNDKMYLFEHQSRKKLSAPRGMNETGCHPLESEGQGFWGM